jgi:hypothetical protein
MLANSGSSTVSSMPYMWCAGTVPMTEIGASGAETQRARIAPEFSRALFASARQRLAMRLRLAGAARGEADHHEAVSSGHEVGSGDRLKRRAQARTSSSVRSRNRDIRRAARPAPPRRAPRA